MMLDQPQAAAVPLPRFSKDNFSIWQGQSWFKENTPNALPPGPVYKPPCCNYIDSDDQYISAADSDDQYATFEGQSVSILPLGLVYHAADCDLEHTIRSALDGACFHKSKKKGKGDYGAGRPWSRFILPINQDHAKQYDLVPKLIGWQGKNMKRIADSCGAKLRIRGKGSLHKEVRSPCGALVEANVQLQLCLSCS